MLSKKDKQGFAVIGAVAAAIVGLVAFRVVHHPPRPGPDDCIGNPDASTAIVIDRSDDVTQQALDEIRARAMGYVADSVKDNELVSVFTVTEGAASNLRPLISRCRPRRTGNELTENVKSLDKAYRQNFEAPLESVLTSAPDTSSESPIAQVLTDLSLSRFLRARKNTLLVFSDMLENTSRFTLYNCVTPSDVIARFRASRSGARERPQFTNTMVKLNIIPRLGQPRTEIGCRDTLWNWFFGDDSGTNAGLDVDYLPGGPPVHPSKAGVDQ